MACIAKIRPRESHCGSNLSLSLQKKNRVATVARPPRRLKTGQAVVFAETFHGIASCARSTNGKPIFLNASHFPTAVLGRPLAFLFGPRKTGPPSPFSHRIFWNWSLERHHSRFITSTVDVVFLQLDAVLPTSTSRPTVSSLVSRNPISSQ